MTTTNKTYSVDTPFATRNSDGTVCVTIECSPFGAWEKRDVRVNKDGSVDVWQDDFGDENAVYTSCHSLSAHDLERIRSAAQNAR